MITCTIDVENVGSLAASGTVVTDPVPAMISERGGFQISALRSSARADAWMI